MRMTIGDLRNWRKEMIGFGILTKNIKISCNYTMILMLDIYEHCSYYKVMDAMHLPRLGNRGWRSQNGSAPQH